VHEVDARGYGHLVMAWNRAAAECTRPERRPMAAAPVRADRADFQIRPSAGRDAVVLLVPPVAPAEPLAVATLSSERRDYLIHSAGVADVDTLADLCQQLAPRVVIVDAGLVQRLGVEPLRLLVHRRASTRWMVGWNAPLQRWAELLLHVEVRGCIEWAQDKWAVARAIDAVMAGELWFPRWVMHWLYLHMLHAARLEAPASGTCMDSGPALTDREVQVVALMREGLTNREIGERLGISINTVKKHVGHAFEKRGLHHRRQAYAAEPLGF
jgi:DNA-binding NarL/FixJ family response regulator